MVNFGLLPPPHGGGPHGGGWLAKSAGRAHHLGHCGDDFPQLSALGRLHGLWLTAAVTHLRHGLEPSPPISGRMVCPNYIGAGPLAPLRISMRRTTQTDAGPAGSAGL